LTNPDALRFDHQHHNHAVRFVSSLLPGSAVFTRAYTQVPHLVAIATLLTGNEAVYALMTLSRLPASKLPLVLRRFTSTRPRRFTAVGILRRATACAAWKRSPTGSVQWFSTSMRRARTDQLIHSRTEKSPAGVRWVHCRFF
jgi:hypothetical protein